MIDLILQTPGALPPLIWGGAGIGKSSRVRAIAEALGLFLETLIASIREPQDFGGMPMPHKDGIKLDPPFWAKRLAEKGQGLAFIDEISCTPPATQAALLRVVQERVIGELELPKGIKFIAAANPPEQAAGGWDLAFPLANRFTHVQWGAPSSREWSDWLLSGTGREAVRILDLEAWEKSFSRAKSLMSGFVKKFPDAINEDPAKIVGRFPPAYATPRTMENATRLYATVLATGSEDFALPMIAGSVGEGIATKFLTWVREADLPDPEELLKNPKMWNPDPSRQDATFAVLNSVAYAATENQTDPKVYTARWKAAWLVLERAMGCGKDLVVVAARRLAQEKYRPKMQLNDPKIVSIVGSLRDVVKESGLFEG